MSRRAPLVVLAVAALLLLLWLGLRRDPAPALAPEADPVAELPEQVADEELTQLAGELMAVTHPRDPQLGVVAPGAIMLIRHVDMLQWHEQCDGEGCRHFLEWAPEPIDTTLFEEPKDYVNPALPMTGERFPAEELQLNGQPIGYDLVASLPIVSYPLDAAELPENIAASFRVDDGVLLSAWPDDEPLAGDLRIRYEAQLGGAVEITVRACSHGLQRPAQPCD